MSKKEQKFSLEGRILKMNTAENIKVELSNKKIMDCHLSKKLKKYSSYMLEGDPVIVEIDIYDLKRGKIIERVKVK